MQNAVTWLLWLCAVLALAALALFLAFLVLFLLSYAFPKRMGRWRRMLKRLGWNAKGNLFGSSIAFDGELGGLDAEYDEQQDAQVENLRRRLEVLENEVLQERLKPAGEADEL